MEKEKFLTQTLKRIPVGEHLAEIMAAAIAAVDPYKIVKQHLEERLRQIDSAEYGRVLVIGAGKAGYPMARAAAEVLDDRIRDGVVIVKEGHKSSEPIPAPIEILEAAHPVPDMRGVRGTQQLLEMLSRARADDLVLCLISGGGSALLTAPADFIQLSDLQKITGLLLDCGASIQEINTIRKHLSEVKGGALAKAAAPANVLTLILSDVIGDPLDMIASGPTAPDPTTYADAWAVLEKYALVRKVPRVIRERLQNGAAGKLEDTPKPGDKVFDQVENTLVGNNRTAAEAALRKAEQLGFKTRLITDQMTGEAREIAEVAAYEFTRQNALPTLQIVGGETTVTLQGDGQGGRNQELCLAAVPFLSGKQNAALISLATDGGDGPTDAAGAVVTGGTLARAEKLGLSWQVHLANNDAYNFFKPLGDLLMPGPTQTNVCDLVFVVWW